jgi:sulfatase maturation enzyme AslB (radical SAM superfamily)
LNQRGWAGVWNGIEFQALRRDILRREVKDTCAPCFEGRRYYSDHFTPFMELPMLGARKKNFLRAHKNCSEGRVLLDSHPCFLYLDVSSKCEIRCRKCFVQNAIVEQEGGFMSMSTFAKVVPILSGVIRVTCSGIGESSLHPQFMEIIRTITQHGCHASFITSGNPLTPELCRELVKAGVVEIVFSIDSMKDDLYAYHHRGGSLARVKENIMAIQRARKELNSSGPYLIWFMVGMKSNLAEFPEAVRTAVDLGFRSIYVEQLVPPREGYKRAYYDFYREENVVSNEEDAHFAVDALGGARELAQSLGISFSSAYDFILNGGACRAERLQTLKGQ